MNQAQPSSDKQNENNINDESTSTDLDPISKINTIQEELEAFAIIKVLLRDVIPLNKITYKDTESYFCVLFENNTWKCICRLKLETTKKYIIIPDENKKPQKYTLDSVDDIFKYADDIKKVASEYIEK